MPLAPLPIAPQPVLSPQCMLEYASGSLDRPARWPRIALLVAGVPGMICPFISFTYSTSPALVVHEYVQNLVTQTPRFLDTLILIAAPFFLAIVISVRQLRLLIRSPATLAEHIVVLCLAGVSVCASGYVLCCGFADMFHRSINLRDMSIMLVGMMFLVAGFVTFVVLWRKTFPRDSLGSVALNTAYLINAGMCLAGFFGDYDAGAWLAATTGVVLIIETTILTRESARFYRG